MALPRRLPGSRGHRGGPEGTWGWPPPSQSTGTPLFQPLPSGLGSTVGQGLGGSAGGGSHQGPPPLLCPKTPVAKDPPKTRLQRGSQPTPLPQPFPRGSWGPPPAPRFPPQALASHAGLSTSIS